MIEITPDKVQQFRQKLRDEMFGSQLWYRPTKGGNRDILVIHPECPLSNKKGVVPEHRYIWWLHHKDGTVEYNECIHHINGDHRDNRIENLEKLKMKQHGQAHKCLKEQKLNGVG